MTYVYKYASTIHFINRIMSTSVASNNNKTKCVSKLNQKTTITALNQIYFKLIIKSLNHLS